MMITYKVYIQNILYNETFFKKYDYQVINSRGNKNTIVTLFNLIYLKLCCKIHLHYFAYIYTHI
jgi:hypothetical protein